MVARVPLVIGPDGLPEQLQSGDTLAGSSSYTLPAATSTTLGGVEPDGVTILNTSGSISVAYGTTANTAAQGNDSRITGALSASATTLPASFTASSLTSAAGGSFGSFAYISSLSYSSLSGLPTLGTLASLNSAAIGTNVSGLGSNVATALGNTAGAAGGFALFSSLGSGAFASTYSLPAATSSVLGGVITSTGITNTSGTISVAYGTTSTTAAAGNDSRITGAAQLATAQTWTAAQSFPASGVLLKGSSTGYTTFASANASATAYTITFPAATDTAVTLAASQALTNKTETYAAGTTSTAPVKFTSGTNLTTAAAGAWEYDGACFYATVAASERGIMRTEQVVALSSAYTLTSQTAAQKLFNATTNGTLTLAVGTYQFECLFSLTSMSTTSGTFGFALGGTATMTQEWQSIASMPSTLATATASYQTTNTTANTALTAVGTTGIGQALIKGIIRVTVAGTIIPEVSLGVAAAAIVGVNSYFKIAPLGSSSVTNVGNWS